jgi:parallel beta-helix repeat protein
MTYIPLDSDDVDAAVQQLVERMMSLGPIVRAPQGTHMVERGSRGRNVHDTISAAVEIAEAGDVILVRPGIYTDPLVIDKAIEIIGVGVMADNERAVVRTEGNTAITYAAGGGHARLAALTIEASGEAACAIDVTDGTLTIRSCRITGRGPIEACVRVGGNGRATIDNNRIVDGEGSGVLVCEGGQVWITDNLISGHAHSCIEARDGAQPLIESNRIANGRSGGVWAHGHAGGEIVRNDISGHHMAGVTVTDGAHPLIEGNRIRNGLDAGIHISDGGNARIEENDIYANEGTGIEIADGGDPLVRNNRLYGGLAGGMALQERARGRLNDNFVRGNQRAGVAFVSGSRPKRFSRNTVIDGLAEGVYDEVGVDRVSNQVERNEGGDWRGPDDV